MDDAIDGDAPLDYASIQIFPKQNRYEAFVCREKQSEKVAAGLLEHLLPNVPGINDLYAKGFDTNFDLKLPENHHGAEWFSKATVKRFLNLVSSPDLINIINAIMDEMVQLEESKNFHLSLYVKDPEDHLKKGEKDGCSSTGVALISKPEVNSASSNASKTELIRALDLRLTALSKKLAATLSKATGATCSPKDMTCLAKLAQLFGSTNIENSFWKFIKLTQKIQEVGLLSNETSPFICDTKNEDANRAVKDSQISKPLQSDTPVKYGVSPAKVAQVERQSSTGSQESSYSSDEGQTSAERSRSLIRSALPKRSASPMRRVQIGRAGPRRAAALTIKSLNYFPAREKPLSHTDAAASGCDEEASEKPNKKPEIDVRRITVQDAINLFESKQRDQSTDIQKRKSLTDVSVSTNKSVLRRWSAGMGEPSAVQSHPEIVTEYHVAVASNNVADVEIPKNSEVEVTSDFISENHNEISESDVKSERQEHINSYTVDNQAESSLNFGEELVKKLAVSAEWNQQKQAEFNQILIKMIESKPVKSGKPQPTRNPKIPIEHRGGSYDHYKEKRDAKLRGDNRGKRVGKEAQFQAMQQILDKRKAEIGSKNVSGSKKKSTLKPQRSPGNSTQIANSTKENSKPSAPKKMASKMLTMPATRKSWSSTPSLRVSGTSTAKSHGGVSLASSTLTCRKSQPTASIPQPSPQREKTQQRKRGEKETQTDNVRNLKSMNEKWRPAVTNKSKTTKAKVTTASGESSAPSSSKISLYNKGQKKSTVVPLESKPYLRKGSGIKSGAINLNKKKNSPQLEESLRNSVDLIVDQESNLVIHASDFVSQHLDRDTAIPSHRNSATEPELQMNDHMQCGETGNLTQAPTKGGEDLKNIEESSFHIKTEEESTISPTAWVEIEEHQELSESCEGSTFQLASPANIAPVGIASPRIRHSLSQMLQEESSEPDSHWGNAENPPAMIYQKDAPKGLKRLLKFARKSKGDTNSTGWSSPSLFSEGEDDAEESKTYSKRNADNLLRKAALHAKSYGQPKSTLYEGYERNSVESNLSKLDGKGSHKMEEGHGAGPTTKASRSFFSLSAFRGSKPAEPKFH